MCGNLRANNICGCDVRKYITNKFNAKAITFVEIRGKAIDVADRLNVSRGQISNWLKMENKIVHAFVDKNRRSLESLVLPESTMNYSRP